MTMTRPWGTYTLLQESTCGWVKRIDVEGGRRLSLQRHKHRDEVWTVTGGSGSYWIGGTCPDASDLRHISLKLGDVVKINAMQWHRLCAGDSGISVIEVALGYVDGVSVCADEDDIERRQDDYGRTS